MTTSRVAVVIGVGAVQGLGAAVALRFAREGYRTVVAGRTEAQLGRVVEWIRSAGFHAEPIVTDATSEDEVVRLIAAAEALGPIEVAVYNAGGNSPRASLETSARFFETLWRVGTLGGFVFTREAVLVMRTRGRGSVLITGASASLRGRPNFVAFAAAKAGLRAVAQAFAREFGPQGIHVAHVVVDGVIDGERIRTLLPDYAASKGVDELLQLEALAEAYWQLHRQHPSAWSHEIDLRPAKEPF